ncbi:DUF885 domain-containing protein [Marinihelvus fidelis]|uniref:DUF885 domain-containing protein n=1 Tax=Marinihelvus fidelis TaxID=2613842 RepID=A0A5N0T592_9GAMM|nr:DUF885 domain-containing protein [Marinihelvus fidelis]KAA9129654.1 DUF885 domain-containing protein [Marinihelvus fidelis]
MKTLTTTAFLALALTTTALASDNDSWDARVQAEDSIDRLGRLYLELLLEEDPTGAAQFGVHGRDDDTYYYDRRMPDATPAARAAFAAKRELLQGKLASFDQDALSRPDQIDLHILTKRVALDRMIAEELKSYENPLSWTGSLGSAFSGLVLRDYAPLDDRLVSFGARCKATPAFVEGAQATLAPETVQPPKMEKAIALSNLQGMTREGTLFDKTLPELLASSGLVNEQAAAITADCAAAVESIKGFANWLETTVVPREDGEWRLGKELYDRKYDLQLDYPLNPDELLAAAEAWMAERSAELVSVGRKIHDDYLADELKAGTVQPAADTDDQQVVRNIFTKLSEDRSTVDTLIADSYALADSIIGFVEEEQLMDLPPASKLRIEDIPPHLSGVAVAMISTAPPFEPELESVWFWDLPLLAGAEDFLKEYNRPALAVVYIHEGVPGHFVQLEYSNRAERTIPKVFWNGAMVEGWASFITSQMIEQGYTVYPDEPWGHDIQLMVDDKMQLRSVMNAIIDIRLQRSDWPEEEALALMVEKGFQEQAEAAGKITRAKVSSVQLTSYFAGQYAIEQILAEYKEKLGPAFNYKDFNERLVGAGSPPFFAIREFMLGDAADD